jgi:hypothetical protein
MSAPIALLDANVLYDVVLRDVLMQVGLSGLFRARWTARINEEMTGRLTPALHLIRCDKAHNKNMIV